MQNSNSIITIIVLALASILAIFLGGSIGSEDQQTPMMFLSGVVVLGLIFGLGKNLWILMLLLWPLIGRIVVLPLPFTVSNLAVMIVAAGALMQIPLGGFPLRGRLTFIDFMVGVLVINIVGAFAMNPVGVSSLQSSTVGSRPYFEFAMAVLAYLILRNQSLDAKQVKGTILALLVVAAVLSLGKTVSFLVPPVGYALYMFYSDFVPEVESLDPLAAIAQTTGRKSFFLDISQAIILCLVAFSNPLRSLLPTRPLHFGPFLLAVMGILLAGFRSLLLLSAAYVIIGAYYWGGGRALIASAGLSLVGILCVYAASMVVPMPLAVQRSMSFLPGNWDTFVTSEAEGSSDWRFEMWEIAMSGNELIENKVFGDGFGFNARELEIMYAAQEQGGGGFQNTKREHYMLVGGFHSGPISTIRYVGFVGLFIFTVFVVALSIHMWKLMQRARGTPPVPIFLYFGIPAVFMPFFYFVVFGGFDAALPNAVFTAGVYMMFKNSLADYLATEKVEAPATDGPLAGEPTGQFALARGRG